MNIPLSNTKKRYVKTAYDIFLIMRAILKRENKVDRNREHFWTISLDGGLKILNIELVSMGSVKATVVEPMEVFSIPLQKRAVSIVLVHNHPSNTLSPSNADKELTDRLIQCGLMLKVPVADHIIITDEFHYSFEETGLLEELSRSTKYVPDYILKERLQKQLDKTKEEGLKEGATTKALAMATVMKQNGEPVKKIMEYTGLSRAVIGKINKQPAAGTDSP